MMIPDRRDEGLLPREDRDPSEDGKPHTPGHGLAVHGAAFQQDVRGLLAVVTRKGVRSSIGQDAPVALLELGG